MDGRRQPPSPLPRKASAVEICVCVPCTLHPERLQVEWGAVSQAVADPILTYMCTISVELGLCVVGQQSASKGSNPPHCSLTASQNPCSRTAVIAFHIWLYELSPPGRLFTSWPELLKSLLAKAEGMEHTVGSMWKHLQEASIWEEKKWDSFSSCWADFFRHLLVPFAKIYS